MLVCPRPQCAEINHVDAERCHGCGTYLSFGPHLVTEKARKVYGYALKTRRLVPGDCELAAEDNCAGRIEGHHDDYSRPLDVRWLCRKHHMAAHRQAAA